MTNTLHPNFGNCVARKVKEIPRKTTAIVICLVALNIFFLSLQSSLSSSDNSQGILGKPENFQTQDYTLENISKRKRVVMQSVGEPDVKIRELVPLEEEQEQAHESEKRDENSVSFNKNREKKAIGTKMRMKGIGRERNGSKKLKKILVWNDYWKSKALWHKIFHEIIYDKCNSRCIITSEKSQLNSSDAVLFHVLDLHKEKYRVPENRDENQIWIAMSFEPPYILTFSGVDFPRMNRVFNRTMTYRQDSDIIVRHGKYHKIPEEKTPEMMGFPHFMSGWVGSHDNIEERNYAKGKRRLVAWFASSRGCKSQSNRETYIQQLQQYIPVDVYGACGPYKCGIQKTIRNPYKVEHDDCYLLVSVAYKFVLAFENSMCEDYVTEKLYNNLKLNVVPVVFGGSNYSYYAPPNSVIDATQFTPKELADYLQLLDNNDDLYNEYFRWKTRYHIEANDGIPLICDLCDKMNSPLWEEEKKVYDNFDQWFEGKCYPAYPGNESIPYSSTFSLFANSS